MVPNWVLKYTKFGGKQKRAENTAKHLLYYRKHDGERLFLDVKK
jgi:hypothetical protein